MKTTQIKIHLFSIVGRATVKPEGCFRSDAQFEYELSCWHEGRENENDFGEGGEVINKFPIKFVRH